MADSIRQQIINAIDTRLKFIKTVNGYETNLGNNVFQWRVTPVNDVVLPCIEYRDIANERMEGGAIGFFRWRLNIEFEIFTKSGSTTPAEIRKMLSDVYKAIGTDFRWGGLAHDTEQPSDEVKIEQNEKIIGGVIIKFGIIYDAPKWEM